SPVPLGSTATHDPTGIPKSLWARWKSLDETPEKPRNEGNDHLGTNGLIINVLNNPGSRFVKTTVFNYPSCHCENRI
ncbi:MAG: hypothetical protein LM569_05230, partial [Desulfurococcaceae archaeon]|nr:hypothetical protein [Desulfurococcaceae archaeon]